MRTCFLWCSCRVAAINPILMAITFPLCIKYARTPLAIPTKTIILPNNDRGSVLIPKRLILTG